MILEIAILNIKRGFSSEFGTNFEKAKDIIASMEGYISHDFYEPFPKVEYYK